MYSLDDYDYPLPEGLIAQQPADRRDNSRLMHLNRSTGDISHFQFSDIGRLLRPGDVLVVNNTEVIPGRLIGRKDTGGKVEILLLDYASERLKRSAAGTFQCDALIKASKRPKTGARIHFGQDLSGEVVSINDSICRIAFSFEGEFESLLYRLGQVPLPPYIRRHSKAASLEDSRTYQTVYAREKGAIAAPTAGLHFTKRLLSDLDSQGIKIVAITLHVGYGTFSPVRAFDIRNHRMHSETYQVTQAAADVMNDARNTGGRIVAVGTTSVRTLEHVSGSDSAVKAKSGSCDLFIYPGYRFKAVDAVITNFHLPKSSLLMLLSAFAGRRKVLRAYGEATKAQYRFYSYGDAMFVG